MPRIASKIEAALKGKNLLPEQILSFKCSPYGKIAKFLILIALYSKYISYPCYAYAYFVRSERYAYGEDSGQTV